MEPRSYLRLEGFTILALSLAVYFSLDGALWMLLVLALAPDVSMIGYVFNPSIGSASYNAVHTYITPLSIGALAIYIDHRSLLLISLIWIGHIGADRFFGYGLKHKLGFKDTHLSKQPNPASYLKSNQ